MARGRKPEPQGVRAQKAAVRSKRIRTLPETEKTASVSVSAPAWLKGDGLAIWKRLSGRLIQAKLLTGADTETFARYCRNFARWLKLQNVLDEEGETYEAETYATASGEKSDDGAPVRLNKLKRANPAYSIADRLERQLLAVEDRFGMNPAERQRIFVQRAATGTTGDLFDPAPNPGRGSSDPAAKPSAPSAPIKGPIGLLN